MLKVWRVESIRFWFFTEFGCKTVNKIYCTSKCKVESLISQTIYVCCKNKISCQALLCKCFVECYGKNLVKNNRTFEKYDFKYKEAIVDLDVLLICEEKNIIPKFLKFKVTNRQLKFSISISLLILSFKAYGTGRAL